MGFFNKKQKEYATTCSDEQLKEAYHEGEKKLKLASYSGDEKQLKQAMKEHSINEYAMLYRNTPEFKKKKRGNIQV